MPQFYFTLLILLSMSLWSYGQEEKQEAPPFDFKKYRKQIRKAREKKNQEFKDPTRSPLKHQARRKFSTLSYFPIQAAYRVKATIELTPDTDLFAMTTSNGKVKQYRQYALLHFMLKGQKLKLPIYRSPALRRIPKYRHYLFVPFTDLTNGQTTYGAGRYMELYLKPGHGKEVVLDFNTAYNPYCAYSKGYSCPIPPQSNHLPIAIDAGEKQFQQ